MNQNDMVFLKYIGYLQNFLKMVETIQNQTIYLLIGISSSIPLNIISYRVSIYFFVSFILEIPTGVFADVIGKMFSMALGYWFMCLSIILIFLSLLVGQDTLLCYALIGISAIVGATASGLIIATLNTFVQEKVDHHYAQHDKRLPEDFKIKAIAMSQGHGNLMGTLIPCIMLALCILLLRYTDLAKYMLLIPSLINLLLGIYFYKQHKLLVEKVNQNVSIYSKLYKSYICYMNNIIDWWQAVKSNTMGNRSSAIALFVLTIICILLMIHVHTYLMVAQLRASDIYQANFNDLILLIFMATAFNQATYLKGIIVPAVAKKFAPNSLSIVSFGLVIMLSIITLLIYQLNEIIAIYLFALFFRAFLSIGQFVINSSMLHSVPATIRTTAFSIAQTIAILLYTVYSFYLANTDSGINTPQVNVILVAGVALIGLMIVSMQKIREKSN